MPDVFLSYKRDDRQVAEKLVAGLRRAGLDVWWDKDIPPSAPWEATIEAALADAKVVLVCWSQAAVASENVRSEARWARERGRLMQVFVGPCEPPLFFGERQGVDLSGWSGSPSDPGFTTLAASLKAILDSGAPSHEPSAAATPPQPSARLARRPMVWLAVLVVGLVAGALVWFAAPRLPGARQSAEQGQAAHAKPRVAAPRFDVLDDQDAALRKFAGGLQAEMVDQLNQNRIDVALADPNGKAGGNGAGVGYAFGGTVERTGGEISVRVQLNDARQHVTVWSGTFHGPERAASVLQDEIAAEAAQVASRAVGFDFQAKGDTETMGLAIKGDLYALRNRDEDREAEWENQKLLLAKLPNQSSSHSNLAVISLFLAEISTPERAAELRSLATAEIAAALKINPHDTLALFARYLSYPLVGHWQKREGVLLAGLKVDPQAGVLTNHESNFLREVGRLNDAVRWAREAAAAATPSANRNSTLVLALGAAGQSSEASALDDQNIRAWPAHPAVWSARLQTLIHQQRWTEALALFRADTYRPIALGDDEVRAWTAALSAMASGDAAAKRNAAHLLAAIPAKPSSASMPPHENYSPGLRIAMLAILGDQDAAFAQAATYLKTDSFADSSFLFWPGLADFRRDRRFFPFVSGIGLTTYWQRTGNWPDFCAAPGLGYDCKAEAARASKP
jgi:TolB-like protein/Tfp pilus assembly protein PilF